MVILEFGCIPGFWGFSNVQMHLYVEEDKSNEEKEDNLGFFFFFYLSLNSMCNMTVSG